MPHITFPLTSSETHRTITRLAQLHGGTWRPEDTEALQLPPGLPVGSDVSAGTYRCTNCGYELGVRSVQSLPPCPNCERPQEWETLSGGESAADPYPDS
jgi:lipopolysaccharide biosynthesis regulator YciM